MEKKKSEIKKNKKLIPSLILLTIVPNLDVD
jgi:hypothetical protein